MKFSIFTKNTTIILIISPDKERNIIVVVRILLSPCPLKFQILLFFCKNFIIKIFDTKYEHFLLFQKRFWLQKMSPKSGKQNEMWSEFYSSCTLKKLTRTLKCIGQQRPRYYG